MFRTTFDEKRKQWNGLELQMVFNPKSSLGNVILNVLQVNGSRAAQICANTNTITSYDDLYDQIVCVANNLRKIGCQQNDVIFFATNNTADIPAIVFAAFCLGCPVTALQAYSSKREYLHLLNITKPKYVICDKENNETLKKCIVDLNYEPQLFTFDGQPDDSRSVESLFRKGDAELHRFFIPTQLDGTREIAMILQSSGSTGMPKGVCLSHASILNTMRRYSSVIRARDVLLTFANIYAISAMRFLISGTLNGSTRVVNAGKFSPDRFFDIVERCKVSFTHSGVATVKQLLKHPRIETSDLSSIKHYFCGGTQVSHDVIQNMNRYLKNGKFCQNYGMTEMAGHVAINLYHQRNNCVGQMISGCEAKVINDEGKRLGIGETGELCFRKEYPFLGYLGGDANANNCFDSEGFFVTGDIARFDENGDLFIVGRKKELFKCGGVHVTPTEIEEFLDKLDGVMQSCLVPIPDPAGDFLPAVVIVKTVDSTCTEQSIYDAVENNFAYHKRLEGGVYFVESLPMTATGKQSRGSVGQLAIELYKNRKNYENVT